MLFLGKISTDSNVKLKLQPIQTDQQKDLEILGFFKKYF